jgi:hypothetical protein
VRTAFTSGRYRSFGEVYNNAARFLELSEQEIARHHGR